MSSAIFQSVVARALKETLNEVIDDPTDGYEKKLIYPKWCNVDTMPDAYIDDVEYGGPGLASEFAEGQELPTGTIKEGYVTRYIARKFGLKMIVSDEAIEDNKYPIVINCARRLKRAEMKTEDIDATNMLTRGFNPQYIGGDMQPLWSATHTLPNGGTWSNIMATPMSPSRAAFIIARSQVMKFPGHDGTIEGNDIEAVLHPTEQWAVWEGIVKSNKAPEPGSFNEINVAYIHDFKLIPIKYWVNTTTNYAFQTDADNGFNFYWRRKRRSTTWNEDATEVGLYGISARWARGWSDARCSLGVQA